MAPEEEVVEVTGVEDEDGVLFSIVEVVLGVGMMCRAPRIPPMAPMTAARLVMIPE